MALVQISLFCILKADISSFPWYLVYQSLSKAVSASVDLLYNIKMCAPINNSFLFRYENDVKHVPILQGLNGYGFAEPHNIYKTLEDLINHYHNQSLRMHNNKLDTTLRTPYRLIESKDVEPIYE